MATAASPSSIYAPRNQQTYFECSVLTDSLKTQQRKILEEMVSARARGAQWKENEASNLCWFQGKKDPKRKTGQTRSVSNGNVFKSRGRKVELKRRFLLLFV